MTKIIIIALTSIVSFILVARLWIRFRRFRTEVFIENLRLWREFLTGYYERHPDEEPPPEGIAVAAVYMAKNSDHRHKMYAMAWNNVRKGSKSSGRE